MKVDFLVRVSCMTFNHAPYIIDAMNGFTMQKTTFPYICIIIDDASTDGEPEVIRHYLQDHFELDDTSLTQHDVTEDYERFYSRHKENIYCYFLVVLLKHNHYSIKKSKYPYYKDWIQGPAIKYIAFCEGDDYWTDPMKLQKQVDFLETHSDYAMSYTSFNCLDQKTGSVKKGKESNFNGFKNLLLENCIATLTVVLRTDYYWEYYKEINPAQYKWSMGDYPKWLYMAANYKIHYLPDVTSVYRMHQGSMSRPLDFEKKKKLLQDHVAIQHFFAEKYNMPNEIIKTIDYISNYKLTLAYINRKRYKNAFGVMRKLTLKDSFKCLAHIILKMIKK